MTSNLNWKQGDPASVKYIGHRKQAQKLTFRKLGFRQSGFVWFI